MRTIYGPQGPRVVLDGRPVLLLSSNNALGLADHSRVREAAADAAMRWGVGAGSARDVAGTMTVHRRLEAGLADFHGTEAALLVDAPGLPAGRVFADALNAVDVPGAVVYEHADADHLGWCLRQHAGGGAAVIATDAVFADGDVAPLAELADYARRHGARLVVDEAHSVGTLGPGGRGALAAAGVRDAVLIGSLGHALGAHGHYVAGAVADLDALPASRGIAPSPPVVAGAQAALELLLEKPHRVDKLAANAALLRDGLAREGFDVTGSDTHVIALVVGDEADARAMSEAALVQGVYVEVLVAAGTARLRLCAMATHTRQELAEAARVIGRAALRCGLRPGTMVSVAEAQTGGDVVPLVRRAA